MIQNDFELAGTQERIAYFCRLVAHMRQMEKPENFPFMASGYLAEIERMNAEALEYLRQPLGYASETMMADAA